MKPVADIAERTITSVTWKTMSNIGRIAISFTRITLLARLLPVHVFGTYGLAHSMIVLSGELASFGMGGAFLHRAPETEDETQAAAHHFTLKLVFTLGWAICMATGSLLLTDGGTRTALLVLTGVRGCTHLCQTPQLILCRRVVHRRLALLELAESASMTVVSLGLALRGAELWALLAMDFALLAARFLILYVWRPVWRPQLAWSSAIVRYYLDFGRRNVIVHLLAQALDRVDDLWTGLWLGDLSLGFYSKAYEFATYPSKIVSRSINDVETGTFAELHGDRLHLSQAFFRIIAFLARSGFLLGGLLLLAAPELISLVLGDRWLPMQTSFRLMLVFTLLAPIKSTLANLFTAIGRPEQVAQVRSMQLIVLLIGLFCLGPSFGISGVAVAVDIMLVVGIGILLRRARAHVDFSLGTLLAAPTLAVAVGAVLTWGVVAVIGLQHPHWLTGMIKIGVFSFWYVSVLLFLEGRKLYKMALQATSRLDLR